MQDFIGMNDFEEVEEQYAPMISAMIRKLHIYREHENYRQAGKIALWQAWTRFDEKKGDFTPFAYRSIRGAMLDELKKDGRYMEIFLLSEGSHFEELAAQTADEQLPEWVEEAGLSGKEHHLLQGLFIEDKSIRQLAEEYGISIAGMKKRKSRLLEKLRLSESFWNRE